jgi:hypothetical protein
MLKQVFKYLTPFALLLGGIVFQDFTKSSDSLAFARSGCLIVLYGIFIESLYVIRATGEGATIQKRLIVSAGDESRLQISFSEYLKMVPSHYGLIWVCVGTVIWGFGDLIK